MENISIVIPSWRGSCPELLASIASQTCKPDDVQIVCGVSPNGHARNVGVAQTHGDILVFIDDDAVLGHNGVIENLVKPLGSDPSIGVTGASKLIPPDSSWFQRWVAREVPRIEHPVVDTLVETNPEPPYYYCEITTTCCAMLVPNTWVWHPAPATFRALLSKHFMYGKGHAQEVFRDPRRALGLQRNPWLYLLFRTAVLLPNIILPYSYADRNMRLSFKPLKAIVSYASALGYVWESIMHSLSS